MLMTEKQPKGQKNEGEGNRTAARQYNEAQRRFVKSGKVEEKAKDAERAVEGKEGDRLHEAELVGKRHTHEEDPEIKR
jgi:phage repressor protein C with HTH and peptisase S24 domain